MEEWMSSHPNVCIFGLNYPPEPTGIAPYTGALAVELSQKGYAVVAHVAQPHYPEWAIRHGFRQWVRRERVDGVEVQRRLHYVPASPRGIRRLISEVTFGLRLIFAKWGQPDVAIAVSPSLFSTALVVLRLKLATRRRPRLIVWVQDIYTLGLAETGEGSQLSQRIMRWVEGATFRAADQVVVIHQRFASFVCREFGVDDSRVAVVRNWTHLPKMAPVDADEARTTLDWPKGITLAVHTGNMGSKQGLENIVEAARLADVRQLPVHFLLVGDGGERASLEGLARGISRITFIDPLDDDKYRFALGAADVLIVNEKPGVSAMAVPSKLTSYFDAGRPVVGATDPGGITATEIEAADAGVIVDAGDPEALLNTIIQLAADPEAMARFGVNGRLYRASVLDQEAAIERWSDVIDHVAITGTPN
ncbi:glycosyltransferase family 4 protein [Mycolicibacterium austroafricanum]|uniref:Glycosyltransferase family 4 protein n=1 Tax=Mycolicibacterium austroafricanum TaxID=39687 RepID=A0ABT8HPA9_MYCAO|nr:glycosyltransferase family 4 protein [Mycolicibacterium austroafricanum]MDN4522380.1 glycosyltransferase family 4 protein [Mycolicibacterium austroafricanum]